LIKEQITTILKEKDHKCIRRYLVRFKQPPLQTKT